MQKIILDVDHYLQHIENIFMKYVQLPEGLLFVKNNRYPLINKDNLEKYSKLEVLNTMPWHPILCVYCVVDALMYLIHNNSSDKKLFLKNPILSNGGESFINSFSVELEDIIQMHIDSAMHNVISDTYRLRNDYSAINDIDVPIEHNDMQKIVKYIKNIYQVVQLYTEPYPDNLFGFEIDTGYITLVNKGDIRAIRFDEYIEHTIIEE